MRCFTRCVATKIDLTSLDIEAQQKGLRTSKFWKTLQVYDAKSDVLCHYFENGTLVVWNAKKYNLSNYTNLVKPFCDRWLPYSLRENYCYTLRNKTTMKPHPYFNVEMLTLDEESAELKLSLAYGFSQSLKLRFFEKQLEELIEDYSPIIDQISHNANKAPPRKKIQQILSKILLTKSQINLNWEFIYLPKFFWSHANLETNYLMIKNYLDIPERIQTINQQLDTLNEVFELFNQYLNNKYSHFLELIIIVLITIEVIMGLFHHFK